jgi:DNA-binding MarR family transcriptional regulator
MARTSTAKAGVRGESSTDRAAVTEAVDAFRRILRALRIAARDTLATAGVSAAQLFVLSALVDGREASLSDLADRTMTDRTSVKAVVERLVAAGLATKATSMEDRRRAAVRITPRGRTLLRGAPRPPTAMLVDALERLEGSELRRLSRGLRGLTEAMGIAGDPAEMLFEEHQQSAGMPGARRSGGTHVRSSR